LGHSFQGLPIAWQGPAYPLFLGQVYRLTGDSSVMMGKYVNVALSILTLIMLYFLFCRFSENKFFRLGAYTLAAFLPNYLAYNNVIGTEVFFTFLFVLILLLQVYSFNNWLRIPLLGISIGAAALTKPFFLIYPVVAGLYFWLKDKELKKTIIFLAALFFMAALVIAPWTYRNYRQYGEFIPVSYNGGYVLYINNNDLNVTVGWMDPLDVPATAELERAKRDILQRYNGQVQLSYELDPDLKEAASRWIAAHPLEFMKLGFLRLRTTFFMGAWDLRSWAMNELPPTNDLREEADYRRGLSFFHALCDTLVYLLSSFGLWFMFASIIPVGKAIWRKGPALPDRVLIPTINLAFFLFIIFVFEGQARYNYPALFLLITGLFSALPAVDQ
jgi:4-amino-4-deoxy-L-arabinose transferase-like glycosyltransferase